MLEWQIAAGERCGFSNRLTCEKGVIVGIFSHVSERGARYGGLFPGISHELNTRDTYSFLLNI